MEWGDRVAGHVLLEEADLSLLDALPKEVAFQVRQWADKKRTVWFIGTRSNVKRWGDDDEPFAEFAPDGSPKFVKLALETAAPFVAAFDAYCEFVAESFSDEPVYGPSKRIGELSLNVQIATLLGTKVLTLLDDDDAAASLACISEPQRVVRVHCATPTADLLFEKGKLTITPLTHQPGRDAFEPLHEQWAELPGVKMAKKRIRPRQSQQLVNEELDAFVGASIAEPDTVFPSYEEMELIAQPASGGKTRLM